MSGHSKWANIKNRKGAQDKKRSEAFTKASKDIMTALRVGSGLSIAIDKARSVNMPKENIERLINRFNERKGNLQSFYIEGFGPFGVPVIVEVDTDNKNRTLSEIKFVFKENDGVVGEEGTVMYQFEKLGIVEVVEDLSEDQILMLIDEGVVDVRQKNIYVQVRDLETIKSKLKAMGLAIERSEIVFEPKIPVNLTEEQAGRIMDLIDALEENEDTVNVWTGGFYE